MSVGTHAHAIRATHRVCRRVYLGVRVEVNTAIAAAQRRCLRAARIRTGALSPTVAVLALITTGCAASQPAPASSHASQALAPSRSAKSVVAASSATGSSVAAATRAATCTAGQLEGSVGENGPANGTENIVILLRNISAAGCWLGGVLPLSASQANDVVRQLLFHGSTDPAVARQPATTGPGLLKPGHYGAFIVTVCLAARTKCEASHLQLVTLRIQLPGNQIISMPYPAAFKLGMPGTESAAEPVPSPTGILGR